MDHKDTNKENAFQKKSGAKNPDKLVVIVSAALLLGALTLTGLYISGRRSENPIGEDRELIDPDLLNVKEIELHQADGPDLMQSVDSGEVENPGRTGNAGSGQTSAGQTDAGRTSNTLIGNMDISVESLEDLLDLELSGQELSLISESLDLSGEEIAELVETMMFHFDGTDMLWPVSRTNDVLIPYSMDRAVYFKTLDQYKYNPAMIVAAEIGTPVHAVASGRITEKYWDEETGWTYEMDLGGGFKAYYGQLDDLQKDVDTYVLEGDILGYISSPTKYYAEEGSNLYFAMTKNDSPVYPLDYLGE